MKTMYIEFSGENVGYSENYKRYCGEEKFNPLSQNDEVIKFVDYETYEKLEKYKDFLINTSSSIIKHIESINLKVENNNGEVVIKITGKDEVYLLNGETFNFEFKMPKELSK